MTNTKFRKRALLSSVAMLLVALVALGSATFAWFVDDPTADAKGLEASSQSATGLLIATDSSGLSNFTHHATLACTSNTATDKITGIYFSPAIFNKNDKKFYTVKAQSESASTALGTATWGDVTTLGHQAGNGVYKEVIKLQKTGTHGTTQDVNLTRVDLGTAGNMANAVTVLICDSSDAILASYSKAANDVPCLNKASVKNTTYTASTPAAADKITTVAQSGDSNLSTAQKVGTFAANSTNDTIELHLYVYLNGEHSSVYSNNATSAASCVTKCDLYFALA